MLATYAGALALQSACVNHEDSVAVEVEAE
jgi:hypothetical protein